jgi:hypothetical protein
MPISPEEKRVATAASMLVIEAVEALVNQLNLHSLQVTWVPKSPEKTESHVLSAGFASFGCPQCGGGCMAIAVKNLPQEMRAAFAQMFSIEISGAHGAEIIHLSPEPKTVQ